MSSSASHPSDPGQRPSLRTVIAHPSATGRMALQLLLDTEDGLDVVGEADDATRAGRLAHELRATFLVIHETLLARAHPGPLSPETLLVVLGLESHPAAELAVRAMGAQAYVRWDRASDDLPAALRRLAAQAVSVCRS